VTLGGVAMPLFLRPVFHTKVWGGSNLEQLGYTLPNHNIGEAWGISAHPNGNCEIINGPYKGETLNEVWTNHRELFGDFPSKDFPLMTKIVDANKPLSIHVHPDDAYAYENESGQYGKSECWYIIDAQENAEIVYGLKVDSTDEAKSKVSAQDFTNLFNKIKVQPGEFYFIPAGTVHSIGEGIIAYETMQASDVSYRIYDYERQPLEDENRELQVDKAIDVIEVFNENMNITPDTEMVENHKLTKLVSNDFFTIVKWDIFGTLNYMKPREFVLVSIIKGEGQVIIDGDIYDIKGGNNFILTSDDLDTVFEGEFEIIISYL
jgi:mannose-6-phosphate isomerase